MSDPSFPHFNISYSINRSIKKEQKKKTTQANIPVTEVNYTVEQRKVIQYIQGFLRVTKFAKMGKICNNSWLCQSFFCNLKCFLWIIIRATISAYSIFCDVHLKWLQLEHHKNYQSKCISVSVTQCACNNCFFFIKLTNFEKKISKK